MLEERGHSQSGLDLPTKNFIYLDRNNTPDVWSDIQKTIEAAHKGAAVKDFRSILIVPK